MRRAMRALLPLLPTPFTEREADAVGFALLLFLFILLVAEAVR